MSSFDCYSKSTSVLSVEVTGLSYPYSSYYYGDVAWYKNGSFNKQVTSIYADITGLSAGTSYSIEGRIYWKNPAGGGAGAGWVSLGTQSLKTVISAPSFSSSSKTSTSITIAFSTRTGANRYEIECRLQNGTYEGTYSGTSPSTTFPGLSSNTAYKFRCYAYNTGDRSCDSAWSSYTSVATTGPPNTPSSPPSIVSRGEGSFHLSWPSVSGATSYSLRYKHYSGIYYYVNSISGTTYTLSGLEYGIEYYLSVKAVNSYGSSGYTSEDLGTTTAKSPGNLTCPAYTIDTIDIQVASGMTGNWDYIRVFAYNNGISPSYRDISKATYNSGFKTVTWTSLDPGVEYRFNARTYYTYNGTALDSINWSNDLYVTTEDRPSNFSWTTAKVSGQNFNLTAIEWNGLTSKINEFRIYKNLSVYSFTTAYAGNNFNASIFNEARNAIYNMNTVGLPSTKSSGSDVYASYLNDLVNCLNAIS